MKTFLLFSGVFVCVLWPIQLQAQWQPDARLTIDSAVSYTSFTGKCIAVSPNGAGGNVVHAVWRDFRDGNFEIYYKRSQDGGKSWKADTRLTSNPAVSDFASVSASGSLVNVTWADCRDGNWEIYYKRSTDGGTTWEADTRLTNNSAPSQFPASSVSDSVVSVVWQDCRDGNWEIYYKRSPDGGLSWGQDLRLINNSAFSGYPSVSSSGSLVNVVWEDNRFGCPEIYHKRSTDGGIHWDLAERLTNDMANSFSPSVSASGSLVHVVWFDSRDGNSEVYYKRSPDGGVSWGADRRLTSNSAESAFPSVAASGSEVHVVWTDGRDANLEIYYNGSTDGGLTWGTDTRLTNDAASSMDASIAVSGSGATGGLHVLWTDRRDGNAEIYYKRNPTGGPRITGIENGGVENPKEFALEQNYPNPFNPTTKITFTLSSQERDAARSHVMLKVYDMLGREVATLVNEELKPGSYATTFDASELAGGMYVYQLMSNNRTQVRKMLLMK